MDVEPSEIQKIRLPLGKPFPLGYLRRPGMERKDKDKDAAVPATFGKRVASLRRARGWTQGDLAAACRKHGVKLDVSKVSHIESDDPRGGVSMSTMLALEAALDTSLDYLLCRTKDATPRR